MTLSRTLLALIAATLTMGSALAVGLVASIVLQGSKRDQALAKASMILDRADSGAYPFRQFGHQQSEDGKVAMVENSVDSTTGMVTVRGIMNNERETLWPGILVATKLIIRTENSVVVPTVAVQRSQSGNYVFVVRDGIAKVQPVKVDRTSQGTSVIAEGLSGDENVVVDGQLLLSDGSRVEPRARKTGA